MLHSTEGCDIMQQKGLLDDSVKKKKNYFQNSLETTATDPNPLSSWGNGGGGVSGGGSILSVSNQTSVDTYCIVVPHTPEKPLL